MEINLGGPAGKCSNSTIMKATKPLLTFLILAAAAIGAEIDDQLAKAKEGDVVAQMRVAELYAKGEGVAKNPKEAAGWYQKAAEQGNGDAQLSLGKLYLSGKGIPKNSTEAAKWFKLAAEQGRADAQIQMARMHLAGAGVPKDDVEACKWAIVASLQRNAQAKQIIFVAGQRMTPEQRTQAETLAREFLEKKSSDDAMKGIPPVAPPLE
jgi:TPR repeat protein